MAAEPAAGRPKPRSPAEPPGHAAATGDQAWLQGVNAALERVAEQARKPEVKDPSRPATPPPAARAAQKARPAPEHAAPPPQGSTTPIRRYAAPALIGALAGGVLAAAGWWLLVAQPERAGVPPEMGTRPAVETPSPQAPTAPAAPVEAPHPVEPGLALSRALAPLPLLDLRDSQRRAAQQLWVKGPARLVLLRQDLLQTLAPQKKPKGGPRLVAPLFVEPVQVWVRADSPLGQLADLRRGTIDTGQDAGDAQTATQLSLALFGARAAAARPRQRQLPDDEALIALLGQEVDALTRTRASLLTHEAAAAVRSGALRTLPLQPQSSAELPPYRALANGRLGVTNFLLVAGGTAAERERLAAQALTQLCAALPALRSADAANWTEVRPGRARPAVGWPYAAAAVRDGPATAGCRDGR